jgi:hypothetical protein
VEVETIMANDEVTTKNRWNIFLAVTAYLVLTFLWRTFVTAHEYPGRTSQIIDIVVDLFAFVGIIGLRSQLAAALPFNDPRKSKLGLIFGLAIAAGIGLFLIRFTSDTAWRTGHLFYNVY